MVRKKLAIAILALGAMQADLASALGLGTVAIKSQLNEPLNAEIRLLETGDLDASQVRVRLAAAEDFQRAGVERDYFLNNLQFSVEIDQRGGGVVRVTTREAVVEPYLNFVIEARWPSGRLLREYAVLLDPPTFSADATPPVPRTGSGLATVQQQAAQAGATAPTYTATRGAAPASREFPPAGEGEYRIQSSDTLSRIASRFRPASDISVEQTMLAIQQANPNAFIRSNINLIKAGYVLRLPNADEVRSIGMETAAQEVLAQNEAWRTGNDTGSDTLAGPQLDARSGGDREVAGSRAAERLSIAGAGDADRSSAGDGTGAQGGAGVAALQNELLVAQESLDSSRRDNEELQSRLDDMERQIATLQKLLTLKDDQLAALQGSAASTTESSAQEDGSDGERSLDEMAAASAAADGSLDSDAGDDHAGVAPADEVVADEAASEEQAVAVVPPPAVERQSSVPKVTTRRPPEPDLWERLLGNPWLPAGAAALIALLAGGIFVARRRRAQAEAEAEALAELEMAERAAPAPAPEVAAAAPATAAAVVAAAAVSGAEPEETVAEEPVATPVRAETGDVVAEADIYIAYGRYQQAVNLLTGAIQQEPARTDIRIKLLEVYLEMRDREAFRQEFVALQALGDEAAVVQVKEMLSSVDGVADWLNGLPGGSSGAFAAGLAAATAAAAAAPTDSASDAGELFADDPDEAFELELDDNGAAGGEALDLDWLNENGADSVEDDGEGFVLDLGDADDTAAPLPVASDATAFDLDGPLELDEQALDIDAETALPVEEPLPADETAPAAVLGELDLDDDDALDLGDDDLDRVLSELEGDSGDALSAAFGDLDADEIGSGLDDDTLGSSDLGFAPTAELEPLDPTPAPGEAPLDVDVADDFTLELDDLETGAELPAAPADEPRGVAEPVPFAVEGLGDLDQGALDDDATLDELAGFDTPAPAASADALDAAFADFEALGAELDAELPAAGATDEPDFTVDLDNIAPYTPETAAADESDEFDFLADADEVATKLDLARAYIDMGDTDGARDILGEVVQEGTDPQREEAQALLERIV